MRLPGGMRHRSDECRARTHGPQGDPAARQPAAEPLADPLLQRSQHGGRSELPIRLDPVRPAAAEAPARGAGRRPGDVHGLRVARDLAGAVRRMAGRQVRSAPAGDGGRRLRRTRLDRKRQGGIAHHALPGVCRRRSRGRCGVRNCDRQRAEVVSRSSRPRRRSHRRGLRRRFGADRVSDREHDQHGGVPGGVHPMGLDPGLGRGARCALPEGAAGCRGHGRRRRQVRRSGSDKRLRTSPPAEWRRPRSSGSSI